MTTLTELQSMLDTSYVVRRAESMHVIVDGKRFTQYTTAKMQDAHAILNVIKGTKGHIGTVTLEPVVRQYSVIGTRSIEQDNHVSYKKTKLAAVRERNRLGRNPEFISVQIMVTEVDENGRRVKVHPYA